MYISKNYQWTCYFDLRNFQLFVWIISKCYDERFSEDITLNNYHKFHCKK